MMGLRSWILVYWLSCASCILANDLVAKPFNPIEWHGTPTKDANGKSVDNGLATRVAFYKKDMILCCPRLKANIPNTLVKMCMDPTKGKDCTEPFPNWKPQTVGDCDCLQSAVDLTMDDQTKTLWVLDVGIAHPKHGEPPHICSPKVFGINADTQKIVHVINLHSLCNHMTRLQFVQSEVTDDGKQYIYVSDAGNKCLLIWNVNDNTGQRVYLPDDVCEDHQRDVLYMCLIRKDTNKNWLYFTYRSGSNMFGIETKYLHKDASLTHTVDFGKKAEKLIILGTDNYDCMYCRTEKSPDIYKWDTKTKFDEKNFVLVHTGNPDLAETPTHCVPNYEHGVMFTMCSNIVPYLHHLATPADARNSLYVMHVAA